MSTVPRRALRIVALLLALVATPAMAVTLDEAKAERLVGEAASGYLQTVSDAAGPDVRALVQEINARRRAEYERIAARNGIALADVEKLAAKTAISKSLSGHMVEIPGRGWVVK